MTRIERRIWWTIYFLIGFTLIAGVIGLIVFSIMMIFRGSISMAVISFAGGVLVMSIGRVIAEAALDPKAFIAANYASSGLVRCHEKISAAYQSSGPSVSSPASEHGQ